MTEFIDVRNPRSGVNDYRIPVHDADASAAVVAALRQAQPAWRALGAAGRAEVLLAWGLALDGARDALLAAVCADTGRYRESAQEVDAVLSTLRRWCAQGPALLAGTPDRPSAIPSISIRAGHTPFAVAGVISPWNFPLLLSLIDAIPALLAGCAVVIKPSEITPRFVAPLRAAIAQVPQLEAVLQLITGAGHTGATLIGQVDVVCFTGSVATGRKVGEAAARAFVPAFLELGGKDPAIVLDDADIKRAARAIAWGGMGSAGQSCMSIERVYVDRRVAPAFLDALVHEVSRLRHCYPDIRDGEIGPIISEAQAAIAARHLAEALEQGATALCGGQVLDLGGGKWCQPTVLGGVRHGMSVVDEESFAAILPVMTFGSDDEAVALANDTRFGLSAAVFGGDQQRALAVAARLEAGAISINDAALTAVVHEGAKQSFKLSGMGGSRMGSASIARFYRQQSYLISNGADDAWWF
ncbi:aldehyde dehydrogenase family protein [Janthinobacterium tructae]|jgi:succinate-semialdehyde dehydrogenase/glutarate-semialdehyde dehydrogenase|uniref:aldehyde dehydrogenase family protein n=1 Tax=Janthinobacterium tructae TaxID=2590869 RepID=UPI002499BD0A|nr:aldehyde dehydrogenase family protein [Janthinobacterium tructae]MDI3295415.1 aldehyde dehydrogenase family protein [Janthinobacterium tructae]